MSNYQTLIAQAEELRAKADEERRGVIERIKGEIATYEITGDGLTVRKPADGAGAPRGRKPGSSKLNGAAALVPHGTSAVAN